MDLNSICKASLPIGSYIDYIIGVYATVWWIIADDKKNFEDFVDVNRTSKISILKLLNIVYGKPSTGENFHVLSGK